MEGKRIYKIERNNEGLDYNRAERLCIEAIIRFLISSKSKAGPNVPLQGGETLFAVILLLQTFTFPHPKDQ
jgi:hypothetical protein